MLIKSRTLLLTQGMQPTVNTQGLSTPPQIPLPHWQNWRDTTWHLHPLPKSHTVMLDILWVSPGCTAAAHVGEQWDQLSEGQTSFSSLSIMSFLSPWQAAKLPGEQAGSTDSNLHPPQQEVSHCCLLLPLHGVVVGLWPNQLRWYLPFSQTYSRCMYLM